MKFSRLFLLTTLILIACSGSVTDSEDPQLPKELSKAEKQIVEADRTFSIEMFKELALKTENENVFISPLSISMALGMTLNGANGNTFDEIQSTLSLNEMSLPEINEGYRSLIELLTTVDPKVQMEIANSVWSRQGISIEDEFSNNLTNYFDAETSELDFDNPESKDVINSWVSEKTHGKIEEIINGISPGTMMYLINAVYFKGDWVYAFDEELTKEMSFSLESDETIETEMMNQEINADYYITDNFEMIDLPYGDGLFTMSLIKPSNNISINTFIENNLSLDNLETWYQSSTKDTVGVFLPKLELEYDENLNTALANLGMPTAFTRSADFSGINPDLPLQITSVKHKTYLKLDEEGTEAAGVTSVEVGITSVGPKNTVISFDRSYLMILREKESGAILFIGKILNPSG